MSVVNASPTKTQFYTANGYGRDSYIYANNGGFCPPHSACKIEGVSKSPTTPRSPPCPKATLLSRRK